MYNVRGWLKCFWIVSACAFALLGCGGAAGGSGSGSGGNGLAAVYVGDAFSDTYSQVWMTLYHIDASTDGTSWRPVFDSSSGMAMNLSALGGSVRFMGAMSLPAGNYMVARVTIGDHMKLVDTHGAVLNPPVQATSGTQMGGKYTFSVNMPMSLAAGQSANMPFDFDLANFQMQNGTLLMAVKAMAADHFNGLEQESWLRGTLSNLDPGVSFALNMGMMSSVLVHLSQSTLVTSEATGLAAQLQNGQAVEVQGSVDPVSHSLTAASVVVLDGAAGQVYVSCRGTVQSMDFGAGSFTVQPMSSMGFVPSGASVPVQTEANTVFWKMMMMGSGSGSLSDLTMGEMVMVNGVYNPSTGVITATQVGMS